MEKKLSVAATVDEVIQRFSTLTLNNNSLWGTMLVTEMLLHCALANNYMFDDESAYKKPTLKQQILQFICLIS